MSTIKKLKQDIYASFNGSENITRTEQRAIIYAVDYLLARRMIALKRYENELPEMVSDDDLAAVFKGTNFGSMTPRQVVADTLLKLAGDFDTGSTAIACCQELKLLGKPKDPYKRPELTKLGRRYLFAAFSEEA